MRYKVARYASKSRPGVMYEYRAAWTVHRNGVHWRVTVWGNGQLKGDARGVIVRATDFDAEGLVTASVEDLIDKRWGTPRQPQRSAEKEAPP